MIDRDAQRLSFGADAERYDRARPGYPGEAVAWLVGAEPCSVLELGAGTGKLTSLLIAAGHSVMATDPDQQMLALLAQKMPALEVAPASAEDIPAAAGAFDVVIAGQAFHWFDPAVALPEISRVLRPGGVLALVWNYRDDSIPWVRKLSRLIDSDHHGTDWSEMFAEHEHFEPAETATFRHRQTVRRGDLVDLVASNSNVAILDPAERAERLAAVGSLYDEYGRGPDGLQLPYLAHCFRMAAKPRRVEPSGSSGPSEPGRSGEPGGSGRSDGSGEPTRTTPPAEDDSLLIDFQ